MRNRLKQPAYDQAAGRAEGESPMALSGFLFVTALRPLAFAAEQGWIALRPLVEILFPDNWPAEPAADLGRDVKPVAAAERQKDCST